MRRRDRGGHLGGGRRGRARPAGASAPGGSRAARGAPAAAASIPPPPSSRARARAAARAGCRRDRSRSPSAGRRACASRAAASARAIAGTSCGSREPSTSLTGSANVSVSGGVRLKRPPAAGSETTLVARAGDEPRDPHRLRQLLPRPRRAAATVVVPAVACPEATTPSGTTVRAAPSSATPTRPIATRLTGSAKRTVTTLPRLRPEQRRADVCDRRSRRSSVFAGRDDRRASRSSRAAGCSTVTVSRSPGAMPGPGPDRPVAEVDRQPLSVRRVHDRRRSRRARRSRAARYPPDRSVEAATPAPATREARPRQRAATTRATASAVRNHLRNTTISVCPTLRAEMAGPDGRQRDPARAFARRDRGVPARPADRTPRLPRRRRDVRRPADLRLRRRRGRRGHDRGPQDRDAAREPTRLRRGGRVRRGRPGSWRSVIAYGTYEELAGDAIEPRSGAPARAFRAHRGPRRGAATARPGRRRPSHPPR